MSSNLIESKGLLKQKIEFDFGSALTFSRYFNMLILRNSQSENGVT